MNNPTGPYIIGQPGGPSGPFWSIVNQQGNVIAMQVISEDFARAIVAGLELLEGRSQAPTVPEDIRADIMYLVSTVSIVHHRKTFEYADTEAVIKAGRVEKWLKEVKVSDGPKAHL